MGIKTEKKEKFDWMEDYPAAVTVCDDKGIIIAMNRRSIAQFRKRGGAELIGSSLFDCHPESANIIIREQLKTQQPNVYITESTSGRRLVQQVPWYNNGVFAGLVETTGPIAAEIPVKQRG